MKLEIWFKGHRLTDTKEDEEATKTLLFTASSEVTVRLTISGSESDVDHVLHELQVVKGRPTTLELGGPPPGQKQLSE